MDELQYPFKNWETSGFDTLAMVAQEIDDLYNQKEAYRKLARRLIKKIQRTDLTNDKKAELKSAITEKDWTREGLVDLFKTKGGNSED